ncbi:MAG: hypothetical protein HYR73_05135 [Candidatus Eisenbacteria bacterium]|nr:hypothetical protein [Candidatus Eisenbacteria bacterium]
MIHVFGTPDPPVPRLISQLAARGRSVGGTGGIRAGGAGGMGTGSAGGLSASTAGGPPAGGAGGLSATPSESDATLVLGPGPELDELAFGVLLDAWRKARGARLLVLSQVGVHPDARSPRLQRLWALEERARGFALPVLTLRLAPLIGPRSPLWQKLRTRPGLPRDGRQLIQPIAEADVIETLERALDGRAKWEGWYEVAGCDVMSLRELAELARTPHAVRERGEWEPSMAEMEEQRLCETEPWTRHFGFAPRPIAAQVAGWAA